MKRIILALCLLLSFAVVATAADLGKADPRRLVFSETDFSIPRADRIVLDCGTPVYLLRDTELPLVNITVMVRTGSVYVPQAKAGLAAVTGAVMRSGGAGGVAPETVDEQLEFMASSVESAIGSDMGTVSMSTLSRNLGRTLKIFGDVLFRPDFSTKRLEIARKQLVEALRRQNDDPKSVGDREIVRAIYDGHPLGTVPTFASAGAITKQDIISFHRRFYHPANMIVAVSGDFDKQAIVKELNAIFNAAARVKHQDLPQVAQPDARFTPEVIFAQKNVAQTVIRMGHLGIEKNNPDLYAVRVLDYILGGGFTSRLMLEVRTNQGLAYHAGSHFDIGRRFTGSFVAETETKGESTLRVIKLMQDIISGVKMAPVTDQELAAAKDYIINSFMFGFTTPASIVTQRARLEFYGYNADYLEKYRAGIAAVTKKDVQAAAVKYLRPEAFKLVVVGDAVRFEKPLSTLGAVRVLDLNGKM